MDVTSDYVRIVEVGPRDGLQNVMATIPTSTKLDLIKRLHKTGLTCIELTSIVSPRAIPQLADCRTILSDPHIHEITKNDHFRAPVLIPNLKGLDIALTYPVREVAVFVSASEGFSRANINCSVQQGLDRAKAVAQKALQNQRVVRGYVSCIFSCPYDGPTPLSAVLNCVEQLLAMGCYEISLGDTLGVGTPYETERLIKFLLSSGIPIQKLAGHFHDTYGQAIGNIWAAYCCGMRVFDSSVAGLGGCPYAPGAKGNVATEDVVYMFDRAGIKTGVDLDRLVETGVWISQQLNKANDSRTGSAFSAKRLAELQFDKSKKKSESASLKWDQQVAPEGLKVFRNGTNIKVTLDRPRNGNALTTTMISGLTKFMEKIGDDSSITRVIITATGKFFCTGMDLSKGGSPVSQGQATVDAQYQRLTKLFETISNSPQVTIACVQGPAFGGGIGLAFACDIRIMTKHASMTLTEVKLGLCPATISKVVIRELGVPFAREVMLSGRAFWPTELARIGAVHKVVEGESELSMALNDYRVGLKQCAPRASKQIKQLVRLSWADGSRELAQEEGIRRIFSDMMLADNPEVAYGLRQFQKGKKTLDWDAYTLAERVDAKL